MKQIRRHQITESPTVTITVDRSKYINGMSNDDILLVAYHQLENTYHELNLSKPIIIRVNDDDNAYYYEAYITEIAASSCHDELTDS